MKSKVSIVRCDTYSKDELLAAVRRSVDLIGGIRSFVKPSSRVLIKPNILSGRPPEEAVVTHPEFVRALVRLVKEAGASPYIGDSPGSFFTIKSIDEVYEKSGMRKIADEEGAGLVRFDKIVHKKGYPIATAADEFNLIINAPKMKTHSLAVLTGAVKNMYGMVPGLSKVQFHKRSPNIAEFSRTIADIFSVTRPGLSIMDGILGMDGDGPAAGRIRKFDIILASGDAVSLDAVFGEIAGFPYSRDTMLKEAAERGLGTGRLEEIEVCGENIDSVRIKDFKLPRTAFLYRFPAWISRRAARIVYFRPVIDERRCRKCKICVQSCPVDAITITKEASLIDGKKCVKCFCCHEVCPYDAIDIRKNIFAKMIWH